MIIVESVLPFIGILVGLVVLHELGHFVVAKLAGVRVEEFGVGMPPRIWGKRFGETIYSLNWLPLGGFVRLTGEESQRVIVARLNPAGAAARAGLRTDDVVTAVNGEAVHTEEQLAARLAQGAHDGRLRLAIQRAVPGPRGPEISNDEIDLPVLPSTAAYGSFDAESSPDHPASGGSPAATIGRLAGIAVGADPRSLANKRRPVRIAVMAAGAAVNAVIPIVLFAAAAMIPQAEPAGPAVVRSVIAGAPADQAGLQPGDRFVSINDEAMRNSADVARAIQLNLGSDIDVVVERDLATDGATQRQAAGVQVFAATVHARLAPDPLRHIVQPGETTADVAETLGVPQLQVLAAVGLTDPIDLPDGITLDIPGVGPYVTQNDDTVLSVAQDLGVPRRFVEQAAGIDVVNLKPGTVVEIPQGATGISIGNASARTVMVSTGFFKAWEAGWHETLDTLAIARNRIRSWIAGGQAIELTGPIGIAQTTGEVVEQAGWLRLIELAALLSLNLAIINILPLPMLDGGRILFVLIEIARRGKRISPEKEGLVHLAGFVLLITFVIIVSYFDIARAISGESILR